MEGSVTDVKQYDSRARGACELFPSRTKSFLFVNGMTGGRGMCHNAIFDVPSFSRVRTIKYRYYKFSMIGLDEPIHTLKFLTTNVSRKDNTQVIHIERQFLPRVLHLWLWFCFFNYFGSFQEFIAAVRLFSIYRVSSFRSHLVWILLTSASF